eukprot:3572463-Pyramimonas_sp.AAC.1
MYIAWRRTWAIGHPISVDAPQTAIKDTEGAPTETADRAHRDSTIAPTVLQEWPKRWPQEGPTTCHEKSPFL